MNLFDEKNIKPMLIGSQGPPFDDPNFIFELKLDGERCIAYLSPDGTELRNKRNQKMLQKVPELSGIHQHVDRQCILDGELIVMKDGKPDFFEIQRRSLMSNKLRIDLVSKQYPACFTAYDILFVDGEQVTDKPQIERKELLQMVVKSESERFAVSRFIEGCGTALFELAKQQELEGVVGKRKDGRYYFDKRTKDWVKFKNLLDDDFVVCGYIRKENNMTSIILGQYKDGELVYKGHVTMGVCGEPFQEIAVYPRIESPLFIPPKGNEDAVWLSPDLVCTVKFMQRTVNGGMRQPVFKGFRDDKTPKECIDSGE